MIFLIHSNECVKRNGYLHLKLYFLYFIYFSCNQRIFFFFFLERILSFSFVCTTVFRTPKILVFTKLLIFEVFGHCLFYSTILKLKNNNNPEREILQEQKFMFNYEINVIKNYIFVHTFPYFRTNIGTVGLQFLTLYHCWRCTTDEILIFCSQTLVWCLKEYKIYLQKALFRMT